jgi:RNA polymerase sigma-70 factor, ECF subfamily
MSERFVVGFEKVFSQKWFHYKAYMTSSPKIADRTLLEQFCEGDQEAFEELVHRYETKAFSLAIRLTRNQEDAEEVLQDVFVSIHRKAHLFKGQSAFSSWLYRIVVNAAFMKLRKRKNIQSMSLDDGHEGKSLMESIEQNNQNRPKAFEISSDKELSTILEDSIGQLPLQYRSVFLLRDVEGLGNEEVAEVLDLSIPAVKSRLYRARLLLRARLRPHYEDLTGKAVGE